jgi:hypothetical protein
VFGGCRPPSHCRLSSASLESRWWNGSARPVLCVRFFARLCVSWSRSAHDGRRVAVSNVERAPSVPFVRRGCVVYWRSFVCLVSWSFASLASRHALVLASMIATWLILPVVICLSQRLSHACLSINCFIL